MACWSRRTKLNRKPSSDQYATSGTASGSNRRVCQEIEGCLAETREKNSPHSTSTAAGLPGKREMPGGPTGTVGVGRQGRRVPPNSVSKLVGLVALGPPYTPPGGNRRQTFGRCASARRTNREGILDQVLLVLIALGQQRRTAGVVGYGVVGEFEPKPRLFGNRQHALRIESPPLGGNLVDVGRACEVLDEVRAGKRRG